MIFLFDTKFWIFGQKNAFESLMKSIFLIMFKRTLIKIRDQIIFCPKFPRSNNKYHVLYFLNKNKNKYLITALVVFIIISAIQYREERKTKKSWIRRVIEEPKIKICM